MTRFYVSNDLLQKLLILGGISNANDGLVQVVADNFDAEVTQNSEVTDDSNEKQTIRRVKKQRWNVILHQIFLCNVTPVQKPCHA